MTEARVSHLPFRFVSLLPARLAVTSAATTAAITTVTTAAATATIFSRPGFVDCQRAAGKFLTVKLRNRCFAFFFRSHFDKPKTARAAGVAILDH